VELLGESDGLVDGLDDDPLVPGAAQRLSLDDVAGDPVAGKAVACLLRGLPGADLQFHDLTRPHS
jgi:hypothetical protein